jgi:predicted nucleic acid-binding Zn ribbon protein
LKKNWRRTPKGYDGTELTTKNLGDLLPSILAKVGDAYSDRADLILASWPDVIGPKLAPMTQVQSFQEGVLFVKVKNSTLHSLLCQHDKQKILMTLRQKFPKVDIKNIVFRIG